MSILFTQIFIISNALPISLKSEFFSSCNFPSFWGISFSASCKAHLLVTHSLSFLLFEISLFCQHSCKRIPFKITNYFLSQYFEDLISVFSPCHCWYWTVWHQANCHYTLDNLSYCLFKYIVSPLSLHHVLFICLTMFHSGYFLLMVQLANSLFNCVKSAI